MNAPQGPGFQGNLEEFASTRLCIAAEFSLLPSPPARTTSLQGPLGEKGLK